MTHSLPHLKTLLSSLNLNPDLLNDFLKDLNSHELNIFNYAAYNYLDKKNKLHFHNFSYVLRELIFRLFLKRLASDESIKKCDWWCYDQKESVWITDKVYYIVRCNLSEESWNQILKHSYIEKIRKTTVYNSSWWPKDEKKRGLDDILSDLGNDFYDFNETLNSYTHLDEETFKKDSFEKKVKDIFQRIGGIYSYIFYIKDKLENLIFDEIHKTLDDELYSNEDLIDEINTCGMSDSWEIEDVFFNIKMTPKKIIYKGNASVTINIEFMGEDGIGRSLPIEFEGSYNNQMKSNKDLKITSIDSNINNNNKIFDYPNADILD